MLRHRPPPLPAMPTTSSPRPKQPTALATHTRWATWGLALASALAWLPAHAASTSLTTSSASSVSVGSSSDSLGTSSDSASPKQRVAQGTYTVVAVTEVAATTHGAGAPLRVQLRLQATQATQTAPNPHGAPGATVTQGASEAPTTEWVLTLPRDTVTRNGLAQGQHLQVAHRPYGLALSLPTADATGPQPPFFLVLDDAWHREIDSQALGS